MLRAGLEAGWVDPSWVGFGSLFLRLKMGRVKFFKIKMGRVGLGQIFFNQNGSGWVGSISEKSIMGWVGLGQNISNTDGSIFVRKKS